MVHSADLQKLDHALLRDWARARLASPLLLGRVQFIDYEYTGYNYQAFDIGNHFNEFAGEQGLLFDLTQDPSLCWGWVCGETLR